MFLSAALFLAASAAALPAPQVLSVDLDGDGKAETVTARISGSTIRVEVEDAGGRRLARAAVASPDKAPDIVLSAGPLGEGGSLLEVAAAGAGRECRTFWRLRAGKLESLPLIGTKGRISDCADAQGWTDRWVRAASDAPADYVRERTQATPRGDFHRIEVFQFAGFQLQMDAKRSRADIAGVAIPDIAPVALYPQPLVEALLTCFDLSGFRKHARMRIAADPEQGIFDVVLEWPAENQRFPVTEVKPGTDPRELLWTVGSGAEAAHLRVHLALDRRTPIEIATLGHGREWNLSYSSVVRGADGEVEVYATAEDELATQSLAGGWDSKRGNRIQVNLLTTSPAMLEFDKQKVAVNLTHAPAGTDVLLVPHDGSPPRTALRLRGPNAFTRLSVECASGLESCRIRNAGEEFRRLGTAMNVR